MGSWGSVAGPRGIRGGDAGNVPLPCTFRPSPGREEEPRSLSCGPYSAYNSASVVVTVGQHARKGDVPDMTLTTCWSRHTPARPPWRIRAAPATRPSHLVPHIGQSRRIRRDGALPPH